MLEEWQEKSPLSNLVGGHGFCDPFNKVRDLCVDSGVSSSSTANAPAHNSKKLLVSGDSLLKKGPPLSPWQESFPPSGKPAQIIESSTLYPAAHKQRCNPRHLQRVESPY